MDLIKSVFAQGPGEPEPIKITPPEGALTALGPIISGALKLILIMAGLIAFVQLLLGGIGWITSGGDKAAVETARNKIIHAIVGIVVVFAAWALIVLVEQMANICLGFTCEFVPPKLY